MKRIFAGMTAALLAVILVFPFSANAISAKNAILLDCTTGRAIFEKDADRRSLIASTTKIMTALIVCEQCNVLDRVRIPKEAVGVEGSSLYLREGEVLTVQELLYGLMLQSGNDAAVALAIYCGGTVEGFSQMMNDKAHALKLVNTHFENPHGLDSDNHYSSARDLAILAAYAMANPIFSKTVSAKNVQIGERYLKNHNKLLWRLEGADGVKTGYTKAAGRILVSSAVRSGRRLVAVTISAPDDWSDHISMMEMGFQQYSEQRIIASGNVLGKLEIAGGTQGSVELIADEDFDYLLSDKKEQITICLPSPGFVYAPVAENQKAGYAHIYLNDCWIGMVELRYGQTVEQEMVQEQRGLHRLLGGKKNDRTHTKDIIFSRCRVPASCRANDTGWTCYL